MVKNKPNPQIILLESHKIYLALQFLLNEDKECLTEYGEGLLRGLLDPDCKHTIPVVHRDDYNALLKEKKKVITKKVKVLVPRKKLWEK